MEKEELPKKVVENLKTLEKIRGSPVLLLYSMDPLTRENARELDEQFRSVEKIDNVDVILSSGGGDIDATYKIINILTAKSKKITILISDIAKSGATLITLGADEIFMSLNSELGPLDALVPHPREPNKHISALDAFKTFEYIRDYLLESFDKAVFLMVERGVDVNDAVKNAIQLVGSLCQPLYSQIDPIFMGECERTLLIAEEYGKRLLARKMGQSSEQQMKLVEQMVRSYPSHSFVIDIAEAKRSGLNVKELSGEQLELVDEILENIETVEPIIYLSESIQHKEKISKEKKEGA